MPTKPNTLPPKSTATSAQSGGKPTDLPTILGYVKLSSNCCNIKNASAYHNALIGFSTATKIAPTTNVINAPIYGISAVTVNKTPSIKAYGILIIDKIINDNDCKYT